MEQAEPVIIVAGLIGSGKSTITQELGALLGKSTLTLMEPAGKEEGKIYNPYLSQYYTAPERWSFTMQIHLLALRYRMHLQAQWHAMAGAGPAILDSSFYQDVSYAHLQKTLHYMSEHEFQTYQTIYQSMTSNVLLPSFCIRLHVDPDQCNKRIADRMERLEGRRCEQAISLDYLEKLDQEISNMTQVLEGQGVKIIAVDYNLARDGAARLPILQELISEISCNRQPSLFDLHRRII